MSENNNEVNNITITDYLEKFEKENNKKPFINTVENALYNSEDYSEYSEDSSHTIEELAEYLQNLLKESNSIEELIRTVNEEYNNLENSEVLEAYDIGANIADEDNVKEGLSLDYENDMYGIEKGNNKFTYTVMNLNIINDKLILKVCLDKKQQKDDIISPFLDRGPVKTKEGKYGGTNAVIFSYDLTEGEKDGLYNTLKMIVLNSLKEVFNNDALPNWVVLPKHSIVDDPDVDYDKADHGYELLFEDDIAARYPSFDPLERREAARNWVKNNKDNLPDFDNYDFLRSIVFDEYN